jgi:hypothetical protein
MEHMVDKVCWRSEEDASGAGDLESEGIPRPFKPWTG